MTETYRVVTGSLEANCYVVSHGEDAVVIDPGGGLEEVGAHVSEHDLRVHAVLNTHGHVDHLAGAVAVMETYGAPFHLHAADAYLLPRANFYRRFLKDEGKVRIPEIDVSLAGVTSLRFGTLDAGVLHTPGHTPGSVCLRVGGDLFTGDTITAEHRGRTDLPGSDPEALERSLALLAESCPPHVTIRPGHGEPGSAGDVLADWASMPEPRA